MDEKKLIETPEPVKERSEYDKKIDENLAEVQAQTIKKSKLKKVILYTLFILINVVSILVVLLLENKNGDVLAGKEAMRILGKNWYFTSLALFVFIIQISCDTIAYVQMTKKVGVKKPFLLSLRTAIIGKYYDKLTPWSTGGQPAQMAYLSTHGLDTATGCSLPLVRSIIKIYSVGVVATIILTVGGIIVKINPYMMAAAYVSIAGTLIVPLFMLFFIRKPERGNKVTAWILRFLIKLKIVKDYDKQYEKFSVMVRDFIGGMKYLSTNKSTVVVLAATTLIDLLLSNMIPFFIIRAFGIQNLKFWETLIMCFFVTYASYFAPSPGSAGVAELSFYAIFASAITDRYLFWAILFWRIILYYIPIFAGIVMQVSEGIRGHYAKKRKSP